MEARNVPSGSFMGNQLQPLEGIPCPHCSPHPCQPPPTGSGKRPDQSFSAGVMVDQIVVCSSVELANMTHESPLAHLVIQFVAVDRGIDHSVVSKSICRDVTLAGNKKNLTFDKMYC